MTLLLSHARAVVDAVFAAADAIAIQVSCCVVNDRNEELLSARMDGANWPTIGIARAKARSSVALRQDSSGIGAIQVAFPEVITLIDDQLPFRITTLPGGLVLHADGKFCGAVGVSGGMPDQDVACAQAGLVAWSALR